MFAKRGDEARISNLYTNFQSDLLDLNFQNVKRTFVSTSLH